MELGVVLVKVTLTRSGEPSLSGPAAATERLKWAVDEEFCPAAAGCAGENRAKGRARDAKRVQTAIFI